MSSHFGPSSGGRGLSLLVFFLLALFTIGCTGDDGTDAGGADNGSGSDLAEDADDGSSTTETTASDSVDTSDEPPADSNETQARSALEDLVIGLAGGDYRSASRFVVNEGVSEEVVGQLAISEDQAYSPARLDQALADYCAAVDCTRTVEIGEPTSSEPMAVTFLVSVAKADGSTESVEIPLTSFEGRFTVGRLPFGSSDAVSEIVTTTASGVPFYPGHQSANGWRLAPVAARDPLVNLWDANQVLNSGNVVGFSIGATGDFGELASLSDGIVFQQSGSFFDEGFDDTIWIEQVDGGPASLVTAADGDLLLLEGARALDLEEDVVYYQLRTGTQPVDTHSTLFAVNTLTGETETVAVVGGWESGVDFDDIAASYPMVAGMWRGEGFGGPIIIDFATGEVVYNSDEVGLSCFEGEPGCPNYAVITMIDDLLYGLRVPDDEVDQPTARSLHRFDPVTGIETEVTRFAWDDGLWFARSIMALDGAVVISVEDVEGNALPAVVVNLEHGTAATISLAGIATHAYLS